MTEGKEKERKDKLWKGYGREKLNQGRTCTVTEAFDPVLSKTTSKTTY